MVKTASPMHRAQMLVVAAALMDSYGRALVQQRPVGKALAGLWEFPGGKVEPGETPEAALVRELTEELGIAVAPDAVSALTFASAPLTGGLGGDHLLLLLYRCDRWEGDPQPLEATALRWCTPAELRALPMPPADLPFIAVLETALAVPSRQSPAAAGYKSGAGGLVGVKCGGDTATVHREGWP